VRSRVFCAFVLLVSGGALAQVPVPPTPGGVLQTLPPERPALPPTPAEIIFPNQPGPSPHDRNGKRFAVHAFDFAGNTVFPSWRLKRVVERYLDLELNLYDLNVAADAVTEFYHDNGYMLARAVIPPQKVEDGRVQIEIVEGRVGQVLFSGNDRYTSEFLSKWTPSLGPGTLVTTGKLERDLLLINDLPGMRARATLSPGQQFGTSDVLVKAEERPVTGTVTLDNGGRAETGQQRADAALQINNPLGIGDQLSVRGIQTEKRLLKYGQLGYSLPLNGDGLRLGATVSQTRYDIAGDFAALGLQGTAGNTEITLTNPFVRSRGLNEYGTLSYRETALTQRAFGTEISDVKLHVMTAGYAYNGINDDASVSNVAFTFASNFKQASGAPITAEPLRLETDDNHLQPLDRNWDVYLRGNLVFSPDTLPDSEKFSVGGPGSVRAYQPAELRGDSGYQGTVEFHRQFSVAQRAATASIFWDFGTVIFKAPGFADDRRTLSGAGVGLTIYPGKDTTLKLEYAYPLSSIRASDGEHGRFWATASVSF
jgi:hemolysin activation/secretion protein